MIVPLKTPSLPFLASSLACAKIVLASSILPAAYMYCSHSTDQAIRMYSSVARFNLGFATGAPRMDKCSFLTKKT